ncbi:Putative endoribonuclease L-PSP OS=Afipia felis OX=1035 GN=NCTC12722_00086 PE=4 SV=1 [Afipia felis]
MTDVERKLGERGLSVPAAAKSLADYVPVNRVGDLVFVSGQLPVQDGKLAYEGVVGQDLDVETGKKAAVLCALNIIGQLKAAVSSLDRVRCIRLGGFVQSAAGFKDHAAVVNGASEMIVHAFGEKGRHARAAVGCSSLPLGAAVEIEAVFEIESD